MTSSADQTRPRTSLTTACVLVLSFYVLLYLANYGLLRLLDDLGLAPARDNALWWAVVGPIVGTFWLRWRVRK